MSVLPQSQARWRTHHLATVVRGRTEAVGRQSQVEYLFWNTLKGEIRRETDFNGQGVLERDNLLPGKDISKIKLGLREIHARHSTS
jgi:hypothetical protein